MVYNYEKKNSAILEKISRYIAKREGMNQLL
jgi:hypothetical protein